MGLRAWIAGLGLVVAGCASTPEPYYVTVAEALTSPVLGERIVAARRLLSAPQLTESCRDSGVPRRLEARSVQIRLSVGEPFPLSALSIVAVDAADAAMRPTPIAIEVLDTSPPIVRLGSDDADLDEGRLNPLLRGAFRIRVRTLCGVRPAYLFLEGVVT